MALSNGRLFIKNDNLTMCRVGVEFVWRIPTEVQIENRKSLNFPNDRQTVFFIENRYWI